MTLHTHILIWIQGHEDLGVQLIDAARLVEQIELSSNSISNFRRIALTT
jgi:hypothetical protein